MVVSTTSSCTSSCESNCHMLCIDGRALMLEIRGVGFVVEVNDILWCECCLKDASVMAWVYALDVVLFVKDSSDFGCSLCMWLWLIGFDTHDFQILVNPNLWYFNRICEYILLTVFLFTQWYISFYHGRSLCYNEVLLIYKLQSQMYQHIWKLHNVISAFLSRKHLSRIHKDEEITLVKHRHISLNKMTDELKDCSLRDTFDRYNLCFSI